MSGRRRRDGRAQLAVLDAMVFFAVSSLICATMASYAASHSGRGSDWDACAPDMDGLLEVFLMASLGEAPPFESFGFELTGQETFGEALFIVSALVAEGYLAASFWPLFALCLDVLSDLCPQWSPAVRLSALAGGSWVLLAEFGGPPLEGADTYSASQNLGASGGASLTATLLLSPGLLLHGYGV